LPQELGVEYICGRTSRGLQAVGSVRMKRGGMDVDHLGETVCCGIVVIRERLGPRA